MDDEFAQSVAHELGAEMLASETAFGDHMRRCWKMRLLLLPCRKCGTLHRESLAKLGEFARTMRRVLGD